MTDNVQASIGAAVRAAMQERGVSQAKLGEHLHLPQSSIARRLAGEIPWGVAELVLTAQLLEMPPTEFFPAVPVSSS